MGTKMKKTILSLLAGGILTVVLIFGYGYVKESQKSSLARKILSSNGYECTQLRVISTEDFSVGKDMKICAIKAEGTFKDGNNFKAYMQYEPKREMSQNGLEIHMPGMQISKGNFFN
jgi:hypothetical protein